MKQASPQQDPVRGDASREALIQAGLRVFGSIGFDAARTRDIASSAGVNQALIAYHFGGKRGLYLAVFDHILVEMRSRLSPALEPVLAALHASSPPSPQAAVGMLEELITRFVAVLAADESANWATLIIKEQQAPSEAFDRLFEGAMRGLAEATTQLVAIARGWAADASEARVAAFTLIGQALVFRAANAAVLRHLQWTQLGEHEVAMIQQQIRGNIRAIAGAGGNAP